jgi:thymidylate synthase
MTLCFSEASVDDLLHQVFEALFNSEDHPVPTKGPNREARGVTLELTNPRARLSRSETRGRLFSCLGELCWYLSGSDRVEPIEFYLSHYGEFADADGVVHGAYGPRMFAFDGFDQVQYVVDRLREQPDSRKAVVQIFDHEDVSRLHKHVPCTCMLQYFVRPSGLEAVTFMRSNDAYLGLPHDLFAFTMLQELIARSLDVEIGRYVHMVGSLHLYERDVDRARDFLSEGWQSTIEMPAMPSGDPWSSVRRLVATERELREGADPLKVKFDEEPYWQDLARLFAIFALNARGRASDIPGVRGQISSTVFDVFLNDRYGLDE